MHHNKQNAYIDITVKAPTSHFVPQKPIKICCELDQIKKPYLS